MSKATTKEVRALLETASEMFDETGWPTDASQPDSGKAKR
jgi:hypothetical protein